MLVGIDGCENDAQEIRLLLIVSAKFVQTGTWAEVADAVSEAASDPEAATPVPVLNAQECEDFFRKLCRILSLDDSLSDFNKAVQISESLRLKRLHQIQSNIRVLDEMIGVLESDEALLDNQDAMLDLAQIEHHLCSAKDLFFAFPKSADSDTPLPIVQARKAPASVHRAPAETKPPNMSAVETSPPRPPFHLDITNATPTSESAAAAIFAPIASSSSTNEPVSSVTDDSGLQPANNAVEAPGSAAADASPAMVIEDQNEMPLPMFQDLKRPENDLVEHRAAEVAPPKPALMAVDHYNTANAAMPLDVRSAAISRVNEGSLVNPLYDAESSTEISSDAPFRDLTSKSPKLDPIELGTLFSATLTTPGPAPAILRKPGKGRPKKK